MPNVGVRLLGDMQDGHPNQFNNYHHVQMPLLHDALLHDGQSPSLHFFAPAVTRISMRAEFKRLLNILDLPLTEQLVLPTPELEPWKTLT